MCVPDGIRDTVVKFTCCDCGFESMNEQVNERIDGFRLNKFFVSLV